MKKNHLIAIAVVLIIVAGGAFYGGDTYAKVQTPVRGALGAGQFGGAGGFAGRMGMRGMGGGFTAGQIVAASQGSISIKMQNGSSTEIVLVSPTTQVLKSVAGSASDLVVGATVTVAGTQNSDGSLSANSIQIRPAGMNVPNNRVAQ